MDDAYAEAISEDLDALLTEKQQSKLDELHERYCR